MAADVFDKTRDEMECTRRDEQKALQDMYDAQIAKNLKIFDNSLDQLAGKHVKIVGQWTEAVGRRDRKIEKMRAIIASRGDVQVVSSNSSASASPSQMTKSSAACELKVLVV